MCRQVYYMVSTKVLALSIVVLYGLDKGLGFVDSSTIWSQLVDRVQDTYLEDNHLSNISRR